jgi:uncharacterized protein YbbC (DUF1343 family)
MDAIYLYPSVCFFEGTGISLGRGTDKPFRFIGYPANDGGKISFTPKSLPGIALEPPYMDTLCKGIDLTGQGVLIANQPGIKLQWLIEMYKSYPAKEKFFTVFFEKLAGTNKLRDQIIKGMSEDEIKKSWKKDIDAFKQIRKKYLLYVDFE